jgi:hypothetical protein
MSLVSAHGEFVLLHQHLPLDLRVRLLRRREADRAEAAQFSGLKSARLFELLAKHGMLKARRGQHEFPIFSEEQSVFWTRHDPVQSGSKLAEG